MDPNDRGVRKFRVALVTMALLTLGYAACGVWPALSVVYAEYAMALLGAAATFSGSNVLEKWRRPAP